MVIHWFFSTDNSKRALPCDTSCLILWIFSRAITLNANLLHLIPMMSSLHTGSLNFQYRLLHEWYNEPKYARKAKRLSVIDEVLWIYLFADGTLSQWIRIWTVKFITNSFTNFDCIFVSFFNNCSKNEYFITRRMRSWTQTFDRFICCIVLCTGIY